MSTPPIGRLSELDRLDQALRMVRTNGTSLLFTGDPGIGKSTIVRAATEQAGRAGLVVLETTGAEPEEELAYAGLHQLLRPVMGLTEELPPAQARALATAFGFQDGPPPELFLVGLATLSLLTDVASEKSVLVAVDDLHWLDRPTQEVLAFVARRLTADRIVMVLAMRTGHDSPLLHAGPEMLTLNGLEDSAARKLLAQVANDLSETEREQILLQAMGNPLALVELPTAWRTAGTAMAQLVPQLVPLSGRLERAFAARLPELPPLTRDGLLVAAVDAEDDLPEILSATSKLTGRVVEATIFEPAVQAGLLTFDSTRLRFRHPLVKSGILQSESMTRRQMASAALAEVLVEHPLRRTWYRAQATIGPDDEVADELERAHVVALRRGSVTSAISALERSAQLTLGSQQRGRRLLLAAELGWGLGHADLVSRLLAEAGKHQLSDLDRARLEWLRELPDDTDLRSARRIAELCAVAGRAAGAGDADLALNLLVAAAVRCHWGWPDPEVRDWVVSATEKMPEFEDDPRYVAALAVAQPLPQCARVRELLSRVSLAEPAASDGLFLRGMAAFAVGDQLLAADFLVKAATGCRLEGRFGLLAQVLALYSAVGMDLGVWREAAAAADEANRLASETHQSTWRAGTLATITRGLALRGEVDLAFSQATELDNTAGARGNTCSRASAVLARAFACINTDRYSEAFNLLRRLFDPDDVTRHERERLPGIMFLAEAGVHSGQRDAARGIVRELEDSAAHIPSPLLHVHLSYARAVLASEDVAEELYLRALQQDLARWPLVQGRLELAYGTWLRRQRRVKEAKAPLRSAHTTLDWIGAVKWAEQALSELRAAGDRGATKDASGEGLAWQDELTPQERQIAALAAQGLSNRQIGERLFMSHRTVGAHLHHIYPKLGITSRVQLAAMFNARE